MKAKNIFSNRYLNYGLILITGLFLGWLLFHPGHKHSSADETVQSDTQGTIWTCAMHPQIRMPQPGKCPICGMDLIPLEQGGSQPEELGAVHLTAEAAQLANVQTSVVSKQLPFKEVRLYGTVGTDERLIQSQVAQIGGRIENLNISFTGEPVAFGQKLAQLYSPDLVTAQQELLIAAKTRESQPELYAAAKEKLRQWKLTDNQISGIESSGKVQSTVDILSTSSGVVMSRKVSRGDYVSQGTVLFEIADLSRVWILFDAYENDLPYVRNNENISFSVQALPGESFSGNITFVDPVIDPVNRVARVRVEIGNKSGRLKPGMFVTGYVTSRPEGFGESLIIPKSSVLWTGKRSIVYVKENGTTDYVFKLREIELGPMLGESYVVKSGLMEGEEIVTRGTFSVDAAAQLEGKPSMMNPQGGIKTSSMPGMVMPGELKTDNDQSMPDMDMPGDMNSMPDMKKDHAKIQNIIFRVSGNCEMCKDRIETAAKSVKGVISATWNMYTKMANVEFDQSVTTLDAIQKAIATAGHDNGKYLAPDEVYSKLPDCCLFRKQ
jgi:Cu(I)/Ag(I) efflux system membrane fusion protein